MDSKKKAKALDRRYKALVEKICTKHGIPTELQLEILSYIDGMVYDAWDNRQMETLLAFSVSYKAGNAVLIRDKLSLSKKEFLAWKRIPYYVESCEFASNIFDRQNW